MAMSLNAIYVIWLREMKKYVWNKSRLVGNLATPFFFLAFMGMGFNSLGISELPEGVSYIDFLAPGVVAMTLLFGSMFAGISILFDRQFGFLKEIMVSPVDRVSIAIGRIFAGMSSGVIQASFILCISILLGVKIASVTGLLFSVVFIVLIAMSFVGLGICIASKMQDMHGFQMIMNFIIMLTFLLSGALFPVDRLPTWLASISYLDPLTYGVDGLRGLIIGSSHLPVSVDLIVLCVFCTGTILLATYLFNRTEV